MKDVKKRVLSLFSGCGGMDLGIEGGFSTPVYSINQDIHKNYVDFIENNKIYLRRTTFETVFANDILNGAESAWISFFSQRNPKASEIFHKESIVDLVAKYREGAFNFPENIDIVTGGFPCQDFSVAGKRNGFNSHKNHKGEVYSEPTEATRGKLYLWMKDVISITKPKVFIAENVKGISSLGNIKRTVEEDLRDIDQGYTLLDGQILNARDYGVAQNRERVIFIGISNRYAHPNTISDLLNNGPKSLVYPYPSPSHGQDLMPFVTLQDILRDLEEPHASPDPAQQSYSKAKFYGKVQGGTEVNLAAQSPTIRAEHHGNIEYRRLAREHGGKNTEELQRGLIERRLSVRECARIQSFPDEYKFVFREKYNLSASESYKIIGNAVPPLVGFAIATHLEKIWGNLFRGK